MPDLVYDTLEAIPEGLKEVAKKGEDGKFTVKVVPAAKLDEFRDRNIEVSKDRDALKLIVDKVKPFIGEDPDAFATRVTELESIATKVKDGTLKGSDAITAEVENRVKVMKGDFERQLAEQAQKAATAEAGKKASDEKYQRTLIDRAVTSAVVDPNSGALPDALDDILQRSYRVFKVMDDGKIVAMDGTAVRYGADGASPMTPLEWLASIRAKAPYLFKGSNGGGSNNGTNQGGGGADTTFGMTKEAYAKLSPDAKLALVHKDKRTAKTALTR